MRSLACRVIPRPTQRSKLAAYRIAQNLIAWFAPTRLVGEAWIVLARGTLAPADRGEFAVEALSRPRLLALSA